MLHVVLSPPPVIENPSPPSSKKGVFWPQTKPFWAGFLIGGVVWEPWSKPGRKKWDFSFFFQFFFQFFFFFFSKIPPHFIPKQCLLDGYLPTYIYRNRPAVQGIFFPGRGAPNRHLQQVWKVFPTAAVHPGNFWYHGNSPRCQGRPGEGGSHSCYTGEPTQSNWDPSVPPGIPPITHTSNPSILGIPGRSNLLNPVP